MKKLLTKLCAAAVALVSVFGMAACKDGDDLKVDVYMPDGAPALALAEMMEERDDDITYHVVSASAMQTLVTGDNPAADLAVMPVNLAAKLLGSGENYTMLGTVTHGNLYLLSTDNTQTYYEGNDLNDLIGKTVGTIQMTNVPGLTLKLVLNKYDIPWQVIGNVEEAAADKVNLIAISDPATISPALGYDAYLAAEPLASKKVQATASAPKPLHLVGDLQSLYGGENGYPQAVLVAKNSVAKNKAFIVDFVDDVVEAAAWLQEPDTQIEDIVGAISRNLQDGLSPTLTTGNLTKAVIANCGVYYVKAKNCKQEVIDFLAALSEVQGSAFTVQDKFFYAY